MNTKLLFPLIGSLFDVDEPLPRWPKGKFKPEELKDAIGERLDGGFAIIKNQITLGDPDKGKGFLGQVWDKVAGWGGWVVASAIWWLKKDSFIEKVIKAMEQSLEEQKLK